MTRISKSPEERRLEILEAAQELFMIKGYSATTVSDIVKKVGVAQGLFYYYFKSKKDVFQGVIELYAGQFIDLFLVILRDDTLSLEKKVEKFFEEFPGKGFSKIDNLVNELHHEEHIELHDQIANYVAEMVIPTFASTLQKQTDYDESQAYLAARFIAYGIVGALSEYTLFTEEYERSVLNLKQLIFASLNWK